MINDDVKSEIKRLANLAFEASERVRMLGMSNTEQTYEKRRKQHEEYEIACYEMIKTKRDLNTFVNGIGKEQG